MVSFCVNSCKKNKDREVAREDGSAPAYDSEMRTFVESKCAVSGCHVYGSSDGNYSTYSGMTEDINNGKISNRVLDRQDIPKNSTLSQDELNKFKYWVDNDYGEN